MAPSSLTSRRATLAAAALISVACIGAYANSLGGPMLFDDIPSIAENQSIRSLWPPWPVLIPPVNKSVTGRPLINLTLAVNYAMGGLDVMGYHLLNVLAHLLAALTLFGVVRRTWLRLGPGFSPTQGLYVGLAVALIWGVHPLNTESVTYIIQRCTGIMGLFYLLTLYCVIRGHGSGRQRWWSVAAVLCCALGMTSKEVMVTAPVVVLLYDWIFLSGSLKGALRRRWGLYTVLAMTWAVLAFSLATGWGKIFSERVTRMREVGDVPIPSVVDYALTQLEAIVTYLRLSLWPDPLVFDYGRYLVTGPAQVWPQALLVGLLLVLTVAALRYRPRLGFLGVWFFVILSPTSSIVPLSPQTMAEHRMYLSLAAVVTLVVVGVHRAWQRWVVDRGRGQGLAARIALAGGVSLVVVALGVVTFMRNRDYASMRSIWQDTVEKRPDNPRAHSSLALSYAVRGDFKRAMELLSQSIAGAFKDDPYAYSNRGGIYRELGQLDLAEKDFTRAIELKMKKGQAYLHRGDIYMQRGWLDRAIQDYTDLIQRNPTHLGAVMRRGNAYFRQRRYNEAVQDFNSVLKNLPDQPQTLTARGLALVELGQHERAVEDFSRAIELHPLVAEARFNRGTAYYRMRRYQEAIADFTRAIALKPGYVDAYYNRLVSHVGLGQYEEAWSDFERFKAAGGKPSEALVRQLMQATGRSR